MSRENTFLVGDWLVKLDGLTIQNKQHQKDLDSKVMQLLIYLMENRERVVSRAELLDKLWKDQVVADDVLNVAMSSLRKALGDDFKTPAYIKTLPKKGYRLIAPVKAISPPSSHTKRKPIFLILFLLAITTTLWLLINPSVEPSNPSLKEDSGQSIRLAVLPFDFYSSAKNREYIADGLTEAIINRLVRESDLQVTSRTSVMQYKVEKKSIQEVGEQLNVAWVLEGSVQLEGDKIQVTAQLISVDKDVHIWSETYLKDLSDLLDIQVEVASEIVNRLYLSSKQVTSNHENSILNQIPAAAYDRFLLAQYFHYKGEDEKAMNTYRQAIDIYPDYANAYAHLSHGYFSKAYSGGKDALTFIDEASKLAIKALQLDPNPAYVQLVMGLTYLYKDHNYPAAGEAFQLAFERNNQDLMILEWYVEYLLITKQFDKAEQVAKHMAAISPLAYNKTRTYQALYFGGDYSAAERELTNKALVSSATEQVSLYVWNALASGNHDTLLVHAPLFLKEFKVQQNTIDKFITLLKREGQLSAINFVIDKIPAMDAYDKAKLYAWAGKNEEAILTLQRLVAEGNIQVYTLAIEPAFRMLGDEPGYIALLKQLKLN